MANNDLLLKVCCAPWGTGRLVLQRRGGCFILRRRHYPLLTAIWCFGIMGGLAMIVIRAFPPPLSWMGAVAVMALAALFVLIGIYLETRPPVLIHDTATGAVKAPRAGLEINRNSRFRLGIRPVRFDSGDGILKGEVIYLAPPGEAEGVPLYFECGRGKTLRSLSALFAAEAGMEMYELPEISLGA